jgi:hypothetical protein
MMDPDSSGPGQRSGTRLAAALAYASRGWAVFPLHSWTGTACSCGRRARESPAKHPRTKRGLKDASTDEATIRRWFTSWPDANLGIVTGAQGGIVVLDVDPRHGGDESLAELERVHGDLPSTLEVRTGGGGRHIFFSCADAALKKKAGFLPGLDFQANGAYVVAPPRAWPSPSCMRGGKS